MAPHIRGQGEELHASHSKARKNYSQMDLQECDLNRISSNI